MRAPNQEQILYDNNPNRTRARARARNRKVDTLHIKARQGGKEPVETSNRNEGKAP